MTGKELIRRVTQLSLPLCESAGVSLWDVTFEKEGRNHVLTVYIDREDGIFIEDCEKVSRALDPLLDEPVFDSLPPYTLTVSSAGLERRLSKPEHYAWAEGKQVQITFYKGRQGENTLVATLLGRDENGFRLQKEDGETVTYTAAEIAQMRLYFEM